MNDPSDDTDDPPICCPSCHSDHIEAITTDDQQEAMGFYSIYNSVLKIDNLANRYKCLECYHKF